MIRQSRTAVFADNGSANGPAPRHQSAQHLRDDLARRQARRNSWVLPAAGGLLAAIAVFILPAWRLEAMVGATGISEMLPLAAPPLGIKARILIAIVMAGLVGAVMMLIAPRLMGLVNRKPKSAVRKPAATKAAWDDADDADDDDWDDDYDAEDASWDDDDDGYDDDIDADDVTPVTRSGKAKADDQPKKGRTSLFDRLSRLRNRAQDVSDDDIRDFDDLPRLKPRDAHPDAPARRPIFAHRDLGAPLDSPLDTPQDIPVEAAKAEPAPPAMPAWEAADHQEQAIPASDQVFGQPPLHLNADMLAKEAAEAAQSAVAPVAADAPVMPPPYVPDLASPPVAAPASACAPAEQQAAVEQALDSEQPAAAPVTASEPAPLAAPPVAPHAPAPATMVQPDLALSELTLAELVDRLEHVLAEHQARTSADQPRSADDLAVPAPVHPLQAQSPAVAVAPAPAPAQPAEPAPLNIAPMPAPVAAPAPVPAPAAMAAAAAPSLAEEEEMDRALKAALATLERMTAQR